MEMDEDSTGNTTKSRRSGPDDLLYSVDEVPPWHLSILLGLQVRVLNTFTAATIMRMRNMLSASFFHRLTDSNNSGHFL